MKLKCQLKGTVHGATSNGNREVGPRRCTIKYKEKRLNVNRPLLLGLQFKNGGQSLLLRYTSHNCKARIYFYKFKTYLTKIICAPLPLRKGRFRPGISHSGAQYLRNHIFPPMVHISDGNSEHAAHASRKIFR